MTKLLCLDSTFLEAFRRKLRGGTVLGHVLAQRGLVPCTLAVWVHESMTSIRPPDLDHDFVDYELPFNIRNELFAVLDAHLRRPGAIVIADTTRHPSAARPADFQELTWFSCNPAKPVTEPYMCAVLAGPQAGVQAYERLLREASPYTTVLTLTTLPPGMAIRSGDHLDLAQIDVLLGRVDHILVGAFDERSMILWSRIAPEGAASPCPEIR
jgi:hypothetical protein